MQSINITANEVRLVPRGTMRLLRRVRQLPDAVFLRLFARTYARVCARAYARVYISV